MKTSGAMYSHRTVGRLWLPSPNDTGHIVGRPIPSSHALHQVPRGADFFLLLVVGSQTLRGRLQLE